MGVTAASGTPQYSGTFVPEIWSGKFLVKFYIQTCLTKIANTDYEGEIKKDGDKVIIRQIADITTRKYSKGANLIHQRPEAPNKELEISEARYFDFICDDIDKYQTDMRLMDAWTANANKNMQIDIENEVFADIYSDAASTNKGATAGAKTSGYNLGASGAPVAITKTNILELIVDSASVLDETNSPDDNRWYLMPPFATGMIKKSDLKDASLSGDAESILRKKSGEVGEVGGFMLYRNNNLTSVTDGSFTAWHLMAGHKSALSFASQITEMDTLKAESTFGQIVRGLNAYGYEVLKTSQLADVYVRKG